MFIKFVVDMSDAYYSHDSDTFAVVVLLTFWHLLNAFAVLSWDDLTSIEGFAAGSRYSKTYVFFVRFLQTHVFQEQGYVAQINKCFDLLMNYM